MTYIGELTKNWRPLLAATIGVGSGMSIHGTVTSAMAPSLIADNGWTNAEFALVGGLGVVSSAAIPFIGRMTDVLGVRMTALIGQVAMPLMWFSYSLMPGPIGVYIGLFIFQSIIGMTTTATVYTRLPVQYISGARGLALAIVASGPAFVSAVAGPVINSYIEANGWRAAYQALALATAMLGLITYLMIPKDSAHKGEKRPARRARDDYPLILKSGSFWILFATMYLCNLPLPLILTQLKLVLLANGVSGTGAGVMFTALSVGMLAGRFIAGFGLDKFQPFIVSFVTLAVPSIGLFLIASSLDAPAVLTLAVFLVGFSFGAEGDIIAYIVARQFGVGVYSSVMGLLTAVSSLASASGAAFLSYILASTGSYNPYLITVGCAVILGALPLLWLSRMPKVERDGEAQAQPA